MRTHSLEMTTSRSKGDSTVGVVLNDAGKFVAMVVPLLVRPHNLPNTGGPLLTVGRPGRSMCGSSALSAKLIM